MNWNNPVSLISKPKGTRKQAAANRLAQYKSLILHTMGPTEEAGLRSLAASSNAEQPLGRLYGKGASAARRVRRQNEMAAAAAALLQPEGTPALPPPPQQQQPPPPPIAATPSTALALCRGGMELAAAPAPLAQHIQALQQQVHSLTRQLAIAQPAAAQKLPPAAPPLAPPAATSAEGPIAAGYQQLQLQEIQLQMARVQQL